MMKRAVRIGASVALAVLLLALFLYNVDFREVWDSLRHAQWRWIGVSTALALVAYWVRAVRWQIILRSAGRTRHLSALIATAVGYAAMATLPARAGDLVRPLAISRRDKLPLSAALASMVTERLFDLMTVVFFYLLFVLWPPPMGASGPEATRILELLSLSGWLAAGGLLLMLVVLIALFRYQESFILVLSRLVGRLRSRWQQPTARFLGHFLDGLRVIQRPADLTATLLGSLVLWLIIYAQVQSVLFAFGLDLPFRVSFLLVTLAVAGLAVPTPGGVGGFHKATQLGLTVFFAVDLNLATGVAIAYHAVSFVPITVIGALCLPLLGVPVRPPAALNDSEAAP